jgi:phage-related protein
MNETAVAEAGNLIWLADTLAALRRYPEEVQDEMGYALYLAQIGQKYFRAKPLKGLGPGVLEVVSDHRGDTYREVYTSDSRTPSTFFMSSRRSRRRALEHRGPKSS